MHCIRSIRVRRGLALLAAAVIVIGCSSDSVTGPTTRDNAALILHFDSLMHSSSGDRPAIYSDIALALAEGAPVGTGIITVNGATTRAHVVGLRIVDFSGVANLDSVYAVGAWQGDGSDTAIVFFQAGGTVTALSALDTASADNFGGTASVVPGALGATCKSFTAPSDVEVPTPVQCNLQPSVDSFSIVLGGGAGPTVTLPQQKVSGARVVIEVPPPPC